MSSPAPRPPVAGMGTPWFGRAILGAAILVNAWVFSAGWDQNLLGYHQFRQFQTAITVQHFLQEGVSLAYPTPLLGPPWSVPLEFPLYQASVAGLVQLTGLPLEPAGRLTSWLWFLSALPAAWLLLGRFRLTTEQRQVFLALLLLSPIYLYYSRLFLIESTALSASLWFLYAFGRAVDDRRTAWLAVAWAAGALAAATKFTTWTVHAVAAALLVLPHWRVEWRLERRATRLTLGLAALAVSVPLAAGLGWTGFARAVRAANPEAGFLDSLASTWAFGDLGLRFTAGFWIKTFRVWADAIVGESGLVLLGLLLLWLRGPHTKAALGCVVVFFSGQLVYANLYWVHDYYFYASGVFLIAAAGFALAELGEQPTLAGWRRRGLVVLVLGLQFSAFHRTFANFLHERRPVPDLVELVRAVSAPDEMILVFGLDWDGWLPYHAERRALMFLNGRDLDREAVRRSVERLDPAQVSAVVLAGRLWRDLGLVHETMASLDLGDQPFLFDGANFGIWVPVARQERLRGAVPVERFPPFQMSPRRLEAGTGLTLGAAQIRRRPEFATFEPRPIRAFATSGFAPLEVDFMPVVNAHVVTELTFAVPRGATLFSAVFGLDDASWTGGNQTDGIELVVVVRPPGGDEAVLHRQHLDPVGRPADRGPQKLDLTLPAGATGELTIRILPGPAGSTSYDWSYIGQVRIR